MKRRRTDRQQPQQLIEVIKKSEVAHKALVYQPLNELPVHQVVHNGIIPPLNMMKHKLAPHGVIAAYPLL